MILTPIQLWELEQDLESLLPNSLILTTEVQRREKIEAEMTVPLEGRVSLRL